MWVSMWILISEVHGYEQNFLVNNTQCIINRKDGFKLEVLPCESFVKNI